VEETTTDVHNIDGEYLQDVNIINDAIASFELVTGILTLIERFPMVVGQGDKNGDCPLHMACICYKSDALIIQTLLELFPSALQYQNHQGQNPLHYPLHYACLRALLQISVMKLIDLYPLAVQHATVVVNIPYTGPVIISD
jgi:ankyrin repeat protein